MKRCFTFGRINFHKYEYDVEVTGALPLLIRRCTKCGFREYLDEGSKIGLDDRWIEIHENKSN